MHARHSRGAAPASWLGCTPPQWHAKETQPKVDPSCSRSELLACLSADASISRALGEIIAVPGAMAGNDPLPANCISDLSSVPSATSGTGVCFGDPRAVLPKAD